MARDAGIGVDTLVVSGDSRLLAFVGPSKYIVTVMEACSLDEVRTQQTPLAPGERDVPLEIPQAASREVDQGVGHQPNGTSLFSLPRDRNNKLKVSSPLASFPSRRRIWRGAVEAVSSHLSL